MNKSYKSVWNESTGSWVAVSELATGRSKSKRAKTAISKAILTQIAVGGMGLAGASIAMAGDPVKFGTGATVNVADGVAIGTDAEVDADTGANAGKTGGVAIGSGAYSSGSGVSIGQNAQAGSDSMAMGDSAVATAGGTAIGQNARAFASQAAALGQNASAGGQGSLALGANAGADFKNSTAIGQGATTDRAESVSVGNATIKRQITNVAAGTADTDATNVSQLKALGASFDTSGHVTNTFVSYDTSAKDKLTLGGAAGTKITNLANGAVSTASKDAVNGSQLFAVAQSAADAVGGSSTVGADGKITKPVYKIGDNTYTSLDSALTGAASMAGTGGTGGGTDPLAVHYDTAGKTSVSLGAAGTPVKVSNVDAGTSTTDAVNVGQLTTATSGLSTAVASLKYIGVSATSTGSQAMACGKDALAVGGSSFASADNALAFGTNARATGVNSIAIGAGSTASKDNTFSIGSVGGERRLVNVAIGTGKTDAVNLGQVQSLIAASSPVQSNGLLKSGSMMLGAGLQATPPVSSLAPEYLIASGPTDKTQSLQASGTDSIAIGLNTHATGNTSVAIGSNSNSVGTTSVAVGYGTIANGASSQAFGANANSVSDGGLALGNFATVNSDSANATAIGTNSTAVGENAISFGTESVAIGSGAMVMGNNSSAVGANIVVIGNNTDAENTTGNSIVLGNSNTTSGANSVILGSGVVKATGSNNVVLGNGSDGSQSNVVSIGAAGKERKIVNVAAGTTSTDAVNLGQMNAAIVAGAGGGDGVQYDQAGHTSVTFGGTGAAVKLTNVAAGSSNLDAVNYAQLSALGGKVDSTGKALNAFVAYDDTSMNTITLAGTAGSTKITKLTAGTVNATSTDAVNGTQLFNTASTTAAAIGGGASVDASGKVTKPSITVGGTTYTDIASATTAAGNAATAAVTAAGNAVQYDQVGHTSVTLGGTGAAVKLGNVANGSSTNDAVNFGQLSALGGKVDSTGKALNAFVAYDDATSKDTITLTGTAGSTKITKLTAGTVNATSTDAVNGTQLFNTASTAAAAIGGGASVDASGKVTKPSITIGGTTYTDIASATTAAGNAATAAVTAAGNAVQYDQVGHTSVTLGGTGAAVKLTNVAAGSSNFDAVNYAQLSALGGKVDSTGKALNAFVAYDDTSMNTITLKGATGTTKITKLTNGTLSAASTDAVNGSQLFNSVASVATALGGGSTIDPTTGKISTPKFTVGTTTYDSVAAALAATSSVPSVDGVAYDTSAHNHVTFGGTGSVTPVLLSNVAAGVNGTDAVNLNQLKAMGANVDSTGGVANSFVAYDTAAKGKVTLNNGGAAVTIANVATGVSTTDAVNVGQLNTAMATTQTLSNSLKYIGFGPSQAAFANATGTDSMALGGNAFATADRSLAIGLNARAGYADSVAIGTNSQVTAANTVSIGSAGKERRIMFVATGVKTTDAVNLGQVQSMIAGLAPVQQQQVLQSPVAMSVLGANKLGASAQNWTDVLATGDTDKAGQTTAVGTDAMAIGLNTHATDAQATAIGQNVLATAQGAVAIGNGSLSNGIEATAIGVNASTTAKHALAIGFSASSDSEDGIAIGSEATANAAQSGAFGAQVTVTGAGSFALGNNLEVAGTNTFVLGSNNANVTGNNSVVLGAGSDGSQNNVVSVGAKGKERKIVNVAEGSTTTDAVNLGQMTAAIKAAGTGGTGGDTFVTQEAAGSDLLVGSATDGTHVNFGGKGVASRELINVSAGTTATSAVNLSQLKPAVDALGGGATISATGVVTGPSYSIGGVTKKTVGDAFTAVDTNLTTLNTTVAGITAGGTGLVVQDAATGDITVGALLNGSKVNFAGSAGDRVLTGVADGAITSSSSDAVNGKQIAGISSSFATAIGGGSQMNSDGSVTIPSFSVGGDTVHNVGDAISNIDSRVTNNYADLSSKITNITNGGGVATPNAVAYDSAAKDTLTLGDAAAGTKTKLTNLQDGNVAADSTDAVTGGQLYATNQDVAALQNSVQNIAATGSTSIGVNGANGADGQPGAAGAAGATGADAIAMGDTASASGDHSVVIGGGATASGDGTTVIGGNGSATGANSTAIGSNSNATGANSVALGAGSVADRDNSVSVGSDGHERQITNVAAGTQGTDAVNLNQMNSAVGGIARKAYSGIAAATALTMIPDVDANKTLSIGIGGGTFQGYAATAIGGTARITQNIKVRVGAGWSAAGTTVGAGASYQW